MLLFYAFAEIIYSVFCLLHKGARNSINLQNELWRRNSINYLSCSIIKVHFIPSKVCSVHKFKVIIDANSPLKMRMQLMSLGQITAHVCALRIRDDEISQADSAAVNAPALHSHVASSLPSSSFFLSVQFWPQAPFTFLTACLSVISFTQHNISREVLIYTRAQFLTSVVCRVH